MVYILPQMDQAPVYNLLQPNTPQRLSQALSDPAKRRVMQMRLPVLVCPSDPSSITNTDRRLDPNGLNVDVASSNYVGSHGVDRNYPSDGIFDRDSSRQIRDITDGTTNTLLVGERATPNVANTGRHAAAIWAGVTQYSSGGLPDQGPTCTVANASFQMNTGKWHANTAVYLPNQCFSSMHVGGAQFALADGSVRFINENIFSGMGNPWNDISQWGLFQLLANRSDGRVVGEF
jgi:hypothetical protein